MTSALTTTALGEQTLERVLRIRAVGASGVEQQIERDHQRPARGVGHVVEAERQVRGGLACRRVDDAELPTVREEADGDVRVAKEPLELGGGRIAPRAGHLLRCVEIQRGRCGAVVAEIPDQGDVRARGRGPSGLRRCRGRFGLGLLEDRERIVRVCFEGTACDREARTDLLSALGRVERQLGRQRRARHEHASGVVAEKASEQLVGRADREVALGHRRGCVVRRGEERTKRGRELGADGGDRRFVERGHREDQALDGLCEPEPLAMEDAGRIAVGVG